MTAPTAGTLYNEVVQRVKALMNPTFDETLVMFNDCQWFLSNTVELPALRTYSDLKMPSIYIEADTISFTASTKTIADSDSGFVTAGFTAGDSIVVRGASENLNNLNTRVSTAAAGSLVVLGILEDESAGEDVKIYANHTALPSGYHRHLNLCMNLTHGSEVRIHTSREAMMSHYFPINQAGAVRAVAAEGTNLYFQHVPQLDSGDNAEMVRLHYLKAITALTATTSTPSEIPESMVRRLLVPWACWKEYERAGVMYKDVSRIQGQINYWMSQFFQGLAELRRLLGPSDFGFDSFSA